MNRAVVSLALLFVGCNLEAPFTRATEYSAGWSPTEASSTSTSGDVPTTGSDPGVFSVTGDLSTGSSSTTEATATSATTDAAGPAQLVSFMVTPNPVKAVGPVTLEVVGAGAIDEVEIEVDGEILAVGPGDCFSDPVCCATIAKEGKAYKSLTGLTGGVLGALCDGGKQDFAGLFDLLSTEVIAEATIACEWDIPEPMGEEIDFAKVNVDYLDGMGGDQAIPKVLDEVACLDLEAWYYDDPVMPSKIFACPALCTKIQGNEKAKVDVKFGCESIVPQ